MTPRLKGGLVVGLAVLVACGAAGWRRWNAKSADILEASGTIEATEVHPSFKVSGRLVERPVDEAHRVEQGALIGRLESLDLQAEVERLRGTPRATETQIPLLRTEIRLHKELTRGRIAEAQGAVAAREQAVAELRAGSRRQEVEISAAEVTEAEATLANAEAELRRARMLFVRQLIAAQTVDTAVTAREVARERHRSAVQRHDLLREGPRAEQVRRAEADLQQARALLLQARAGEIETVRKRQQLATVEAAIARDRAGLAVAEAQLGYTVLRSPLTGVVLRKHVEPGEMIGAGTPVVTIADLGSTWLRIYVPEPELGRVKLGLAAEVSTDSYRGKVYPGTVTVVSSEAEFTPKSIQTRAERVKLVFAVKIAVDNPDSELKPGMPADARIRLR